MIAVQALEKRTAELKEKEAQLAELESKLNQKEAQISVEHRTNKSEAGQL